MERRSGGYALGGGITIALVLLGLSLGCSAKGSSAAGGGGFAGTSGGGGPAGGSGGSGVGGGGGTLGGAGGALGGAGGDETGGSGGGGSCTEGAEQACYNGPPGTVGIGICKAGIQTCAGGVWGSCAGQVVAASAEACNALDDDCNGLVDEGFAQTTCGKGACQVTTDSCVNGTAVPCTPKPANPTEACDGVDDDCDGTVDEGCVCVNGQTQSCYSGTPATKGVGPCKAGTQTCSGGQYGACTGQVLPKTETCNGVDDDCNGSTDEGNPGGGAACNTGVPGICAAGTQTCTNGSLGCKQTNQAAPSESCSNSLDDDCDGQVNEGCATTSAQIIHYELEQSSGTSVANLAPGKPAGTITGTLTWTPQGGAPGSSFHLVNPASGGNYVAHGITQNVTSWTIEFRWKFNSGTGTAYMWYDSATSFRAFTNGVANQGVMVRATPGGADVHHTGNLQSGQWHHIAYVMDAATSQGRLYVNGTLSGSSAYSGSYAIGSGLTVIGRTLTNGAEVGFDRYRVWSQALTPAQISSIIAGSL